MPVSAGTVPACPPPSARQFPASELFCSDADVVYAPDNADDDDDGATDDVKEVSVHLSSSSGSSTVSPRAKS